MKLNQSGKSLTYASVGVDRNSRETLHRTIARKILLNSPGLNRQGEMLLLPFNSLRPLLGSNLYLDFQIEGVGTKTLLAEIDWNGYSTIGIDGVAMVANDLIRSGAKPLFLSDAIHIARSDRSIISMLLSGVQEGARLSGAIVVSGETGDVPEILHKHRGGRHSQPFDLFVAGLGLVDRKDIIEGVIEPGNSIIGIESSGIHSNGITLARRVLLRKWGGAFDPYAIPDGLEQQLIKEMLTPTRIYVQAIAEASKKITLNGAIHITGDGFGKFSRFATYLRKASVKVRKKTKATQIGFEFNNIGPLPAIFGLIHDTSRKIKRPISMEEMFRTFNMGYGFCVIVSANEKSRAIDLLNRHFPSRCIGRVTDKGRIKILGASEDQKSVIL